MMACPRHRDGIWRSANGVPRSPEGRPLAYVAVNGHGGCMKWLFIRLEASNNQTAEGICKSVATYRPSSWDSLSRGSSDSWGPACMQMVSASCCDA